MSLFLFSNVVCVQKSIFIPPWRREEEREEKQRQMETAFEQVYQDKHRKRTSQTEGEDARLFLSLSLFV